MLKNKRDRTQIQPKVDPFIVAVMIAMAQVMYNSSTGGVHVDDEDYKHDITFQVMILQ